MSHDKYSSSHQILVGLDPEVIAASDKKLRIAANGGIEISTVAGGSGDIIIDPAGGNIIIDSTDFSVTSGGNLTMAGNIDVGGNISADGNLSIGGNAQIDGDLTIDGSISGTLNGSDVSGSINLDSITAEFVTVTGELGLRLTHPTSPLPVLMGAADSSDGYLTVRKFSPFDFFIKEILNGPDITIAQLDTPSLQAEGNLGATSPINRVIFLSKDLQNEWASGGSSQGWYLESISVYLEQSDQTDQDGFTGLTGNATCEVKLLLTTLDGTSSTLKTWSFLNGDLSSSPSLESLSLSGISESDRTIASGEALLLQVRLGTIQGVGGVNYRNSAFFYGAEVGGKEMVLHP